MSDDLPALLLAPATEDVELRQRLATAFAARWSEPTLS